MVRSDAEILWFFALLSSKCKSIDLSYIIISAFVLLLPYLILNLIFWAHPGGPAWGRQRLRNPSPSVSAAIPGPKGIPIIGSLNLMTGLAHHKLAAAAASCRARRLMAISLGETRAIVTCNPDVAREILNSPSFADRPLIESAYALMFNRSIGFAPYGVYWKTLRKIAAAHLFCPKQIAAAEHQRREIASQMEAIFASRKQLPVRVRDVLKLASLNNMMGSVFGRRYDLKSVNSETEELRYLVEQGYDLLGTVNWSDHLPFLADFDVQKIRSRCAGLVPRVNRFVGGILAEHKAEGGGGKKGDFVDVLLSIKDGSDPLSDEDMIAVLWEMIFRGTDTVAVLIEWILARLVLHQDVQSKVHAELDKVIGSSHRVAEAHTPQLPYLTAVIKEVLRLHPPGPLMAWSRSSITDSTVDGFEIPVGTTSIVNMWAIMRDPTVWSNPLKFEPERFMGRGPDIELGSDPRLAPFGLGRRSCPGKALGMATVKFWVATLLNAFRFVPCGPGVDLSEVLRLSCEMRTPLEARVECRY